MTSDSLNWQIITDWCKCWNRSKDPKLSIFVEEKFIWNLKLKKSILNLAMDFPKWLYWKNIFIFAIIKIKSNYTTENVALFAVWNIGTQGRFIRFSEGNILLLLLSFLIYLLTGSLFYPIEKVLTRWIFAFWIMRFYILVKRLQC